MLTAAEIEDILRVGYEQRHFELKGPGRRDDTQLMAKVIRAALSLGNLRDGGHVVIGIDDEDPASMLPGLTADEAESWRAFDDVSRKMAEYADPPLRFELAEMRLSSGAVVAVLEVAEFDDLPHICSRQLDPSLRKGALYARSRNVPETVEVPSSIEMREVLDLATEKALRSFVQRAQNAGLTLTPPAAVPPQQSAAEAYAAQRNEGLDVTELTDKIRSKGFWDVVIRPADFDPERVPYENLLEVIESAAVRFRGWPVPMVYGRERPLRGTDWIGQDIDATGVDQYEAWRFFTSGQFNHLRGIGADWRPHREAPVPDGFSSVIEVWEVLYYLTEVFELAARLSLAAASGDLVVVEVTLSGLAGRGLVVGQNRRAEFFEPYTTGMPELTTTVSLARDELIGQARAAAVDLARWFFARFGWSPPVEQLVDHQRELTDRP